MPQHAYFVNLETRHPFDVSEYALIAGQMSMVLQRTLGDLATLCELTRTTSLTDCRVEVEIAQCVPEPNSPIVAQAIVKMTTSDKVTFDKIKFTKMVRDSLPFAVKITKQAVPPEDIL